MKAATSVLGALLAGWINSPATAMTLTQNVVRPRTVDQGLTTIAQGAHDCAPHEHASSCTCAHCTGGQKDRL